MPPSEVPLERAAKTQPFPLKPPPLSRMTFSAADVATVTPELEAACRKLIGECSSVVRTCPSRTTACACSSPATTAA